MRFQDLSHLFTPHRQAFHLQNFSSQVAVVRVRIWFPDTQDVLADSGGCWEIAGSAMSGAATPAGKVASSDSRILAWDFLVLTSGTKETLRYWKNSPRCHHYIPIRLMLLPTIQNIQRSLLKLSRWVQGYFPVLGTLSQPGAVIISPSYVRTETLSMSSTLLYLSRIFRSVQRPHVIVSFVVYCVTFLDRPSFCSKLSRWGSTSPSCKM